MQIKLWSSIEQGVNIAYVEISNFTPAEKVQAAKFGALHINLGGAFAAPASGTTPAINFALEPMQVTIDPNIIPEIKTQKVFRKTAEIVEPGYAAKIFCDSNLQKISDAVTNWKSLTDEFIVNYNTVL
jgi:hypothetical protein